MPYDAERIASSLRANRAYKRKTRAQVSSETGIPAATLESYENGRSVMSAENAWTLADYYDKSLDDLVERNCKSA